MKKQSKKPKFVKEVHQRLVIDFYKLLIEGGLPSIHFKPLNALIVHRWSVSGLERIKTKAWRELEQEDPMRFKIR